FPAQAAQGWGKCAGPGIGRARPSCCERSAVLTDRRAGLCETLARLSAPFHLDVSSRLREGWSAKGKLARDHGSHFLRVPALEPGGSFQPSWRRLVHLHLHQLRNTLAAGWTPSEEVERLQQAPSGYIEASQGKPH
ncbi:Hypothetical predicted protein, partial [Marmota monax]